MAQPPQRRGGPATRVARWPGVARGDGRTSSDPPERGKHRRKAASTDAMLIAKTP